MPIFHIFSVYPSADVDGKQCVQQYDFVVRANTLTEAVEHVKGSWIPKRIEEAEAVWGSTRSSTLSLLVGPHSNLHQSKSRGNYEAWVANRDKNHYISIKAWL